MRFHEEILGQRQRNVMRRLGPLASSLDFYLAGGTALALYEGHRRSVDLDWFVQGRLGDPMALAQKLRDTGLPLRIDEIAAGTLHGRISGVRVTFLEYAYDLLDPLVNWPEYGLRLASRVDLGTMKLVALAQRGAKKDFIDLHALCSSAVPLGKLLEYYKQRYHVQDAAHLLYSLAYFEDADKERMPKMLDRVPWTAIKQQFHEWVLQLAGR